MIAYHGSPRTGLKKLEYSTDLSRFGEHNLLHGAGIYLTLSQKEAKAYAMGGSVYTVEVSGEVFDTTDISELDLFVRTFLSNIGASAELSKNKVLQKTLNMITTGEISGADLVHTLFSVMGNEMELYYGVIEEFFEGDSDKCLSELEALFHYKKVRIRHGQDGTDWIICLDKEGSGLEIIEEVGEDDVL